MYPLCIPYLSFSITIHELFTGKSWTGGPRESVQAIASAADKIAELTKKEEVKEPVKVKEAPPAVKDVAEKVAPKMEAKKEEKETKETKEAKETKASRIHVHHIRLIG